ncbi:AMP-binding protein [Rhodococcus wratislaviensis]|nr:AMP-binding protein [Rhodococcus wratislaviensis]
MPIDTHDLEVRTFRDLIVKRAKHGEQPLLLCRGETLTYERANELSNRIANSLADQGITKGDVVATLMYNSVDHALLWFACAKLGAIWAPLNVSLNRDDLIYSLTDAGARMVVVDSELLTAYELARSSLPDGTLEYIWRSPDSDESVNVTGYTEFSDLLAGQATLPEVIITPDDPLAIVYTGGSTSMPKGVLVSHMYFIGAAMRYRDIVEPRADDVHFANSHLFHAGGQQFGVSGPMFCGITGAMTKWFSVSRYWSLVREYGATIIDPLGTMMSALLTPPESDTDQDHNIRVGVGIASGQVRPDLRDEFERRFNIPLLEVYSMTELGVMVCSERINDRRPRSSGKPYGWADLIIVDNNDMPVKTGEIGQILIRPNVPNCFMTEYINKPVETVNAWRNLWYHSGDLGYLDEDGYLYFVGRQAHWIRRRGENVSAFEIEKVISAHHSVVDCAAVGVPSDLGEEDIKVYVQVKDGATWEPEKIVTWCKERIAYFKVPRFIEYVAEFPRTLTKAEIVRHELRSRGAGDAWDSERVTVDD